MQVIPVLDLMGGKVVRARLGDRAAYRPIETPLAAGSSPLAVAGGLLRLHPFRTLYVADLDGIMHGRPDLTSLAALAEAHPAVRFWVDNGLADEAAAAAFLDRFPSARLVVGSETQTDPALARRLGPRAVLSLDFRGETFQGPSALLDDPRLWSDDVIVMTLSRVGSGGGPDTDRLASIAGRAGPDRRIHAAGGVRGIADLRRLRDAGIAGALVATALHDGRLDARALAALEERSQTP